MNINQDNTKYSQERLLLPEPDPANITVLTPNLPNIPILPWNRFNSSRLNNQVLRTKSSASSKINKFTIMIVVLAILLKYPKLGEFMLSIQLKKNNQIKEEELIK